MSALPSTVPRRVRLFSNPRDAGRPVASHLASCIGSPPASVIGLAARRIVLLATGAAKGQGIGQRPRRRSQPTQPTSFPRERLDVTIVRDRAVTDLRNIPTIEKPYA